MPQVDPRYAGQAPCKGTFPAAANSFVYQGETVCVNASGEAVVGALNAGFNAAGIAASTLDNRTTTAEGGAAGARNVEVQYGVFGRVVQGTAPVPGDTVFVYDSYRVTLDSNTNARGVAGSVVDVTVVDGVTIAYVYFGPHVVGLLSVAAVEAADLDQAQTDIDALQANATTAQACIPVPITSWRLSTGAAIPAFSNGVADGLALVDSEAFGLRINDDSTTVFATSIAMPQDLNDAANVVLHLQGMRIGSADTGARVTVGAFFQTEGAAHTADSDAGGDSTTFAAATTVVSEETVTIALADVPAAPCTLTLTMVVKNTTLADDDLVILSTWLEYTKALLAS